MFILGMLIIITSLIYLLVTNNERGALYIFGITSIAYFIFGYGIPLNEINLLLTEANFFNILIEFAIILGTMYLIRRFEDTIFVKDYNLVLRSFFFRFETLTLALYLIGILVSSGRLTTDLLILLAIVRLLKVDKFISYVVVSAVLFTNALFIYPIENIKLLDETINVSGFMHTNSMLVAIIVPVFMLLLYVLGFSVRSLEKDIVVEFKIIGIIITTGIVGLLGVANLNSTQMLIYLPILALVLLYLNDMNVRKKFSRYSQIPLTFSIIVFVAFIGTIYVSQYSFILFIICGVLINSILLNERYVDVEIGYNDNPGSKNTFYIGLVLLFLMVILANYSVYNATEIGVPYIQRELIEEIAASSNVLARSFVLYTNAAYFSAHTTSLIPLTTELPIIQYLVMAIPALTVISVPMQLLILSGTGYKTKISGEILCGVIVVGLLTMTIVSYVIGV